jgi:hypothetical protein
VALQVERVVDRGVDAEKSLGPSGRLETLHRSFPSSNRLMRILGPVVLAQALLMPARKTQVSPRGALGPQLVGHQYGGHKALLPEQLSHQSQSSLLVSPRLHQQIEDFALAVHGPPQPLPGAADRDDHLVEMPLAAWQWSTGAQVASERQPELQDPSPDRLVRNIEAAFCQEFLDVAVAEREAQIEPDGVADDVGRESVSA